MHLGDATSPPREGATVEPGLGHDGWPRAITQDPAAAADVLSQLHRPAHDRGELLALLQATVTLTVRHLDTVDHASLTAELDPGHRTGPFTAATSDVIAWNFDDA